MFINLNINATNNRPTFGFSNEIIKKNTTKTFDSFVKIPKKINQIQTDTVSCATKISTAGELAPEDKILLNKIRSLHKSINTVLKILSPNELSKIKKEYPNLIKYKTDISISFNKYNKLGAGITLINNIFNYNNNPILTIYLRDSQNNIKDVIPIKDDKILKTRNNIKISKFTNPLNYVLENEFLTQEEINSKKINHILKTLHSELESFYEVIVLGGGLIEESLSDKIISVEKDIKQIKKNVATRKIRPQNFKLHSNGAIEFNNINENGDKLYWLQSSSNKKRFGTSIIQLLSQNNKLIDGIAINDERIIANYPLEHKDNFPQKIMFLTSKEIEKLEINKKILLFIEYFNKGKEHFYEEFYKKSELNKQLSTFF